MNTPESPRQTLGRLLRQQHGPSGESGVTKGIGEVARRVARDLENPVYIAGEFEEDTRARIIQSAIEQQLADMTAQRDAARAQLANIREALETPLRLERRIDGGGSGFMPIIEILALCEGIKGEQWAIAHLQRLRSVLETKGAA